MVCYLIYSKYNKKNLLAYLKKYDLNFFVIEQKLFRKINIKFLK